MPAQYLIFLRGNKTESKATLRGLAKQVGVKRFSPAPYLKAFFFFLGKIKSATDLLSFTDGECVLPAALSLLCFCQDFAEARMPFDPVSDCPRPIHLSSWLCRCQLFCEAFPRPPGNCLHTFRILLCVSHSLIFLCVCLPC